MVMKQWIRAGVRMLIAGATLHGLSLCTLADDVVSANHQMPNVSRSRQVSPVSFQSSAGCGVAKVPGCASGGLNCGASACGPQGCVPNGGWGPCGCPSCRAARRSGPPSQQVDLYTFRDVGQQWSDAGDSMRNHAVGWTQRQPDWSPQTDLTDEIGSSPCPLHGQMNCPNCCGWWSNQWALFNARNHQQHGILRAHIHGKLAYVTPMGNGGEGAPPFGCYNMVYAASPNYSDPRDSQVWAAQGYGVPISVPLAPTVRHTMNYSNGMPSSRLTPISNVVPPRGGRGW